jgi:hypothetical protein
MRRASHSHRFAPRLDLMEQRDCPAVLAALTAGALQITGDQSSNAIDVSTAAAGVVHLVGDGQSWDFSGVQSIQIATGDGNDTVRLNVTEQPAAFGVTASVDLGGGDDTFALAVTSAVAPSFSPLPPGPYINVKAAGSIGNDTLSATFGSATSNPAMLVPAVKLSLDGGAGNDAVSAGISGLVLRGTTDVALTGGDGADVLSQDFHGNNVMAAMTVALSGGTGDDRIGSQFDATGVRSVYNAPVNVNLAGNDGNDALNFLLGGSTSGGGGGAGTELGNTTDPVVNVGFNFALDGGAGNDTELAKAVVAGQGRGGLNGRVLGGAGGDDLTLDFGALPPGYNAQGLIDGGDGFDTHHSSATVNVINCEV